MVELARACTSREYGRELCEATIDSTELRRSPTCWLLRDEESVDLDQDRRGDRLIAVARGSNEAEMAGYG